MQLVLPTIATVALGTALLVPLRDDRRGKRATLHAAGTPLQPTFTALEQTPGSEPRRATTLGTSGDDAAAFRPAGIVSASERDAAIPAAASPSDATAAGQAQTPPAAAAAQFGSLAVLLKRMCSSVAWSRKDLLRTDQSVDRREGDGTIEAGRSAGASGASTASWQSRFAAVVRSMTSRTAQNAPAAPNLHDSAPARSPEDECEVASERSFAGELAALLSTRSIVEAPGFEAPSLTTPLVESPLVITPHVEALGVVPSVDTPADTTPTSSTPAIVADAPEIDVRPVADLTPFVLQTSKTAFARVLPLTRLPLRTHVADISWPRLTGTTFEPQTRSERHALLATLGRSADETSQAALMAAYREEDSQGRVLALRALMRVGDVRSHGLYREALHVGNDDERALAIDALMGLGDRAGVQAAFRDRIDAIAAKAALAYVGVATAGEYRTALAPHIDASRIDVVLELLAGIVE